MAKEDLKEKLFREIQDIFRKTPVLLVGSGFSCSYEMPGMKDLAKWLNKKVPELLKSESARKEWNNASESISENLERGLNTIPTGKEEWHEILLVVRKLTSQLIVRKTKKIEAKIIANKSKEFNAPSRLLKILFKGMPQNDECIHVITTNYDTLIELFCDLAELPLDNGFIGHRRRKKSSLFFQTQYSRKIRTEHKKQKAEYCPNKTVRLYKPHGSINWIYEGNEIVEVLNNDPSIESVIIVPGPSKYREALVNNIFNEMRGKMNETFKNAQALFCIGFGFNDEHLQDIINQRLEDKMPIVIINKNSNESIDQILEKYPHIISLFDDKGGTITHWNNQKLKLSEPLWKLNDFLENILE